MAARNPLSAGTGMACSPSRSWENTLYPGTIRLAARKRVTGKMAVPGRSSSVDGRDFTFSAVILQYFSFSESFSLYFSSGSPENRGFGLLSRSSSSEKRTYCRAVWYQPGEWSGRIRSTCATTGFIRLPHFQSPFNAVQPVWGLSSYPPPPPVRPAANTARIPRQATRSRQSAPRRVCELMPGIARPTRFTSIWRCSGRYPYALRRYRAESHIPYVPRILVRLHGAVRRSAGLRVRG